MVDHKVPYFHNTTGFPAIEIGTKTFMCIGAKPPFDHPHEYLEMGHGDEIICPYCSTLYRFSTHLNPNDTLPNNCVWIDEDMT